MCKETEMRSGMFMELKELPYDWCLKCEEERFQMRP